MRIGRMRERVEIQGNTPTTGSRGQPTPVWATTSTVWARVQQVKGDETEQADKITAKRNYEVELRVNTAVNTTNRLKWNSLFLSINASLTNERKAVTVLSCTEVAP